MLSLGIALGVSAAFFQSFSYVCSRRFSVLGHGGAANLLMISHTILGLISLPLIGLLWHEAVWAWSDYLMPLIGASGYYLIGQLFIFAALKRTDASRIAPLLGLKIAMVAMLWVLLSDQGLTPWQWMAVGLAAAAAFILNHTGGSLPLSSLGLILLTCFFYALSDLDIIRLIRRFESAGMGRAQASMLAASMSYLLCGLMVLPLLPWYGLRQASSWRAAVPFSLFWLIGMALLFPTLAIAGPVLGNIALATRGLFSIALGMGLAALGYVHLETQTPFAIVIRRILAAIMMFGAIALYAVETSRLQNAEPVSPPDVPIPAQKGN